MRKNNNRLIGLTVLAVVIMHILAENNLLAAGWSRVLDTAASLLVVAIAYIALGKHANVSILSGSRRELAGRHQDLPRPRGWSGGDRCQPHQYHGWRRYLPAGRLAGGGPLTEAARRGDHPGASSGGGQPSIVSCFTKSQHFAGLPIGIYR